MNIPNGIPVLINDWLGNKTEFRQVRFPRSKKSRIQKKWRKQGKNFCLRSWQEPECYQYGETLVMNSAMAEQLKGLTLK